MTSERKIKANRVNAQTSTGPKTPLGRARAARNALRHALSLPISSNPALSEEVEALEIAGPDATAEIQELARQIAEAQIDVRRVRYARYHFLSDCLSDQYYESPANARMKLKFIGRLLQGKGPDISIEPLEKFLTSTPQGPHKLALILCRRLNSCWPWIATNDVRCRGASLRSGPSMRHKGKPSARANSASSVGQSHAFEGGALGGPPPFAIVTNLHDCNASFLQSQVVSHAQLWQNEAKIFNVSRGQ